MRTYRCTARHETLYDPDARSLHMGTVTVADADAPTACEYIVMPASRPCGRPLTELPDGDDDGVDNSE